MSGIREREEGAVLPIAVAVLLIVILLTGVAVAYSVHGVDRSNYDRNAARALGAADAGLDIARYRMNKALLGGQVVGVIGLVNGTAKALSCTRIGLDAAGLVSLGVNGDPNTATWCAAGGWEPLDGDGAGLLAEDAACGSGSSAAFRYFLRLNLEAEVKVGNDGLVNNDPLAWEVISAGCSNGSMAVVRGTLPIDLSGTLGPDTTLQLFKLEDYSQCRGLEFDPANPAAGCA